MINYNDSIININAPFSELERQLLELDIKRAERSNNKKVNPVIKKFGRINLKGLDKETQFNEVSKRHKYLAENPIYSGKFIGVRDKYVGDSCNLSKRTVGTIRAGHGKFSNFRDKVDLQLIVDHSKIIKNNFELFKSELNCLIKNKLLYNILDLNDIKDTLSEILGLRRTSINNINSRTCGYSAFKNDPKPKIKNTRSKSYTFNLVQMMQSYLINVPLLKRDFTSRMVIISDRLGICERSVNDATYGSHHFSEFRSEVLQEILDNRGLSHSLNFINKFNVNQLVEHSMNELKLDTAYHLMSDTKLGVLYFEIVLPRIEDKKYSDVFFFLPRDAQVSLKRKLMKNYVNKRLKRHL